MALSELAYGLAETALMASAGYLAIVLLIRVIPKRQLGNTSPLDLLGAIMVGGLAVESLVPDSATALDGFVMILAILGINYALAWLSDRYPRLRWILSEPPTQIIRAGRPLTKALRREMLTLDELMIELRKQGIEDLAQVREAFMEADGSVSVIRHPRAAG